MIERIRKLSEDRRRLIASLLESRAAAVAEIRKIDEQLARLKYRGKP